MFAQGRMRSACSIGSTPSSVPSVAAGVADRGRERALDEDQRGREAGGEDGLGAERLRPAAKYAVRTGKPPQASASPQALWNAPAEPLEVVRRHEERAGRDEREQPVAPARRRPDADRAGAGEGGDRERDERPGRGSRVRSGRPFSSSSACAATPSASANAAIVQTIRSVRKCGASAAPSAT